MVTTRSNTKAHDDDPDSPPRRVLRPRKEVTYPFILSANEPQRKRPSRILSSYVKKKNRDNFDTNSTNSPLLNLPPELRNRIFRFALGGKSIHVHSERNGRCLVRTICMRTTDEEEDAEAITSNPKKQLCHDSWETRHEACFEQHGHRKFENAMLGIEEKSASVMNLDILLVCRQIHKEAALIPYQENSFTFNNGRDFNTFIHSLVPAQLRSIPHLVIAMHDFSWNRPLAGETKTKIKNLEFLLFFVEFSGSSKFNFQHSNSVELELIKSMVLEFRRLKLESAKVVGYNALMAGGPNEEEYKYRVLPARSGIPDELLRWGEGIEEELMKEWVSERKKRKEEKGEVQE